MNLIPRKKEKIKVVDFDTKSINGQDVPCFTMFNVVEHVYTNKDYLNKTAESVTFSDVVVRRDALEVMFKQRVKFLLANAIEKFNSKISTFNKQAFEDYKINNNIKESSAYLYATSDRFLSTMYMMDTFIEDNFPYVLDVQVYFGKEFTNVSFADITMAICTYFGTQALTDYRDSNALTEDSKILSDILSELFADVFETFVQLKKEANEIYYAAGMPGALSEKE